MSRFLVSCGCAEECDENASHCSSCGEPIVPTLEKDTNALDVRQREWIDSLREMATFLESRPELIPTWIGMQVDTFRDGKDEMAQAARLLGSCEKEASTSFFSLTKRFGSHSVKVNASREEVCEKVKTGTKTVVEHKLPEGVALVEVTKEIDVYEWKCPESILAGAGK